MCLTRRLRLCAYNRQPNPGGAHAVERKPAPSHCSPAHAYVASAFLASVGCCLALVGATADTLDKTDCNGVLLDDSQFAEPIVRNHRDSGYGAFSNPAMRPLGGGKGYSNIVPSPATVVRTADELRTALQAATRAPQTVYVDDNAEIDLSYCAKTPIPSDSDCRREPRSRPPSCMVHGAHACSRARSPIARCST